MAVSTKPRDFTTLPILYSNTTKHFLYLREHVIKAGNDKAKLPLPNGRTLFVVNIPPDATERELALFFKTCGHVERVSFLNNRWQADDHETVESNGGKNEEQEEQQEENINVVVDVEEGQPTKRRKLSENQSKNKTPPQIVPLPGPELPLRTFCHTGSTAHVVFTDPEALLKALSLSSTPSVQRKWPSSVGMIQPFGLAHYVTLHDAQRPSLKAVKTHADTYTEFYDYNKALSRQNSQYKKGEAIVDEDGFTLVTRGGAYGQTLGGGATVATRQFMKDAALGSGTNSGKRNKNKRHEKDNFYKFQVHERKRKELIDLKRHFAEDLEKVAKLKESKRYRPY